MEDAGITVFFESGSLIGVSIDEGNVDLLNGLESRFDLPNLIGLIDWDVVTPFRRLVFETLLANVPRGSLVTYGELASAVGSPNSARAVGSALSYNPWPLIVPCHRVVRSNGHIGPYSAGEGISTKRRLLIEEGVKIDSEFCFDQKNLTKIAREPRDATIQMKM